MQIFVPMDQEYVSNTAKAELLQYLQKQNGTLLAEETEKNGVRFKIRSTAGREHTILLRLLNLDKERSISILKSDFSNELSDDLWILLARTCT